MENIGKESKKFSEIRKEAKELYNVIEDAWCPALEDIVLFNNKGFHHLMWKGHKTRSIPDQIRRFKLLPLVKDIITNTCVSIVYQKREDGMYWAFSEQRQEQEVIVIIRRVEGGKKHFYSVFEN
jgi:hypothetical protein